MKTITIHRAKTQLSKLIEQVCRGEEIVIARGKHPVAKLVALSSGKMTRVPGKLAGQISHKSGAFDPLTDREMSELGFDQ
ncbi:MAG: type II toxin-antitoxin system Phd/YefM family antitoxin [Terriglobales bacterium]